MASMQSRKKHKRPNRQRKMETPGSFNAKLFVALGLLLVVLLMKKYDLAIGDFNVDSLYHVVYYNEDLNGLKEKIFFFNKNSGETEDTMEKMPLENVNNTLVPDNTSVQDYEETTLNQQELPVTDDSDATNMDMVPSEDVFEVTELQE